jgi:kynurenine formamidase
MKKKNRIVKLGAQSFRIIDLTEPLKENTEVYPGDPRPRKTIFSTMSKGGCRHHIYSLGDHNFHPHGDAPNHQNPELAVRGFESWGLEYVFNQACLIDLSGAKEAEKRAGIKYLKIITAGQLAPYLTQIKKSTALIIRTGYDKWLEANKKHDPTGLPYLDRQAADLLGSIKSLRVIGTDSLTVDQPGVRYAHRKLKDRLLVECLVNLHGVPRRARQSFYLQTSPIAVAGATGGPVLAYAYVPLSEKGKR